MKGGDKQSMDTKQEIYVGLDTHRETIHGTALNKEGELICSYEFPANKEAIGEFMKPFNIWNTYIAIEACNHWKFAYDVLNEKGYEVMLANPAKCRQIAKDKKTDEVDSRILADLRRINYLPKVTILSDKILKLRDLCRHKSNLTRMRTKVQTKIKSHLSRNGIPYEKELWKEEKIAWLKSLNDLEIDNFLRIYDLLRDEEKMTLNLIKKTALMNEEIMLLKTIPGVGYFGAVMIYEEIGDINRFKDPKNLYAYAGVVPGIYQSGSKSRSKTRSEVNYWLKWIVGQCAGSIFRIRRKNKLQKYYFKMKSKKGCKVARKATARKILGIAWHILKEKTPYRES
jgi:transposase